MHYVTTTAETFHKETTLFDAQTTCYGYEEKTETRGCCYKVHVGGV